MSSSGIALAGARGEEEDGEDSRAIRWRAMNAVSCSSSWLASPSDSSVSTREREDGQNSWKEGGGRRRCEVELTFFSWNQDVLLLLVPSLI